MQRKLFDEDRQEVQPSGRIIEKRCWYCEVMGKRYLNAVILRCCLCGRFVCAIEHAYPLFGGDVKCLDRKECESNRSKG